MYANNLGGRVKITQIINLMAYSGSFIMQVPLASEMRKKIQFIILER